MTKSFSERYGYKQPKQIQIKGMDEELRTQLWSVCYSNVFFGGRTNPSSRAMNFKGFFEKMWGAFLKRPLDELPGSVASLSGDVKAAFFEWRWFEVYDFLEFVSQTEGLSSPLFFRERANKVLEREVSGYRFIGEIIAPITDEIEVEEIEEAMDNSPSAGVREHIKTALRLFADRKNPDYRNSIKESISAVEGICKVIAGDDNATLGTALKIVKDKVGLHSALEKGFSNIYGYTNDAEGIRHALMDESNLSSEDARYMLVSCSAFVNYLTEKAQKAGIKL